MDTLDLHLLIRAVHVVAATLILGGAAIVWLLAVRTSAEASRAQAEAVLFAAERYEWVFWASAAAIVATGVGNLGAFGEGLPAPDSEWGGTLLVKLGAVLVLLAGSVVRTLTLVRLLEGRAVPGLAAMHHLYAATAAGALLVVVAAEVLAHG